MICSIAILVVFLFSGLVGPASYPAGEPTPSPLPTSPTIPIKLFFRRPARIIPIYGEEDKFEIVQKVPWLTDKDFTYAEILEEAGKPVLRVYLTPAGKQKYREAMRGNVGRTIILSIDKTSRNALKMVPKRRKDRIHLYGDFTLVEAEKITEFINSRPSPSPTPRPLPTPTPKGSWIIIE